MSLIHNKLNKSIPVPLYFQLKELIMKEIKGGTYKSGDLIPTENELSESFEISRTTVRQAITELVQEGWLYRIKSKGTFVSYPKVGQGFTKKLESFNDEMNRLGITPSTEVFEFSVQEASAEVAEVLEIEEKDKVLYLYRRRFADKEPVVTIQTYLPFSRCSFLADKDFTKESLYHQLALGGDACRVLQVRRIVEAVEATEEDASNLKMKVGKPIQFFVSTGYNALGVPLEYSLARYPGDRSRFEIMVSPE
ncbi:MAG: GntR family transcriptional regulator [Lachnospiraceae bacterium]|nr:GntR family transcriptional regulator [Lachnospiraceae bacterium]